jgi:DNA-binding beta-propeller fold protein YncE
MRKGLGIMRINVFLLSVLVVIGSNGCGSSGSAGSGGGGGTPSNAPTLTGIAPSSAVVGASPLSIVAYGSSFQGSPTIEWNGSGLTTSCVDINLIPVSCSSAAALTATVPASYFAAAGTAKVTLSNPAGAGTSGGTSNALNFIIAPPPSGTTWARTVTGISAPNDIAWDAVRGKLYVSVSSTDPANANTIAVIDPLAGTTTSLFVPAGTNPNLLSVSSDGRYLWAGMDGSNTVQRFLLPGLSKDISFPLPLDWSNKPQEAVALQAAPVSAHTLALIAGHWGWSPAGDGVYIYDDAVARTNQAAGPMIDWMQWGADDTTIYGNQYTTIDAGGIATMSVNSSGVSLTSYGGGLFLQPTITQYDRNNGLLYSYGGAYDPSKLSLMGSFNLPVTGAEACTADSGLIRYYCVTTHSVGGTDATAFELWVFDLNSYALLNRVYFGTTVSGAPWRLVRWGNAGLAVLTQARPYDGNGGVFLIDGAAVNPNATPDTTGGTANSSYAWLSTMTPDVATTTSGDVQVTIKGYGFSPDSTACWNCNFLQFRFLPTTYVSPTQLDVTIPLASVSSTEPLEIGVFDQASNLFSSNALTFTVIPASGTTQITPVNLCGLAMAWDQKSQLLYVATADYDGAYPNSVVAVNPVAGTIVKSQSVESDPAFLSDSADGEYLYVAYDSATNLTQLELPGLNATITAPIKTATGGTWIPGDLKAAPQNPHTVAATLIMPGWHPESVGGVVVFDDGTPRPNSQPGWAGGQTVPAIYDTLAWSASDQLLTSAASFWDDGMTGPLNLLQVDSSGVSYLSGGNSVFNTAGGYIHSDFGTNLIYSDGGSVADPTTATVVGNYGASGLVAPDSSLNRVFILGQTAAQANTNNYTIESFDQKAFSPVSSIALNNVSGSPIALARWGLSGLAVLTSGGLADILENGMGMLYLVQDAKFVTSAQAAAGSRVIGSAEIDARERVQQRWKRMTAREILARVRQIHTNGQAAPLNVTAPK